VAFLAAAVIAVSVKLIAIRSPTGASLGLHRGFNNESHSENL